MAKAKKQTKQTHIPTVWGVVVLVILMIVGIVLVSYETNKQQRQNYRSDAAYSKPKPSAMPKRIPTGKPKPIKKCGGLTYGYCSGGQRCVDSVNGYRCK